MSSRETPSAAAGLDDLRELDRVIHEPARLLVLAHLYVVESADSTFLVAQTGLTWGNLSSHMTRLEQAGYVEVTKEFVDRKPRTLLRLTDEGRSAFGEYIARMRGSLGVLAGVE